MASVEIRRQKYSSQRINNIEMTNIIILKWPIVKKSHELVLAKVFKSQDFCPSPKLTKSVIRRTEYSLVQPESQNQEWLNEKIIQRPFFFYLI